MTKFQDFILCTCGDPFKAHAIELVGSLLVLGECWECDCKQAEWPGEKGKEGAA